MVNLKLLYLLYSFFKVKLIFDKKNTRLLIVFIWLIGLVSASCLIFMTEYIEHTERTERTNNMYSECYLNINFNNLVYLFGLNIIFIFLPTISLFFLYICIIFHLRRNKFLKNNTQMESFIFKDKVTRQKSKTDSLIIEESIKRKKNHSQKSIRKTSINNSSSRYSRSQSVSNQNGISGQVMINLFVSLFFYCCVLPVRVFLLWSYLNTYLVTRSKDYAMDFTEKQFNIINTIANTVKVIYFTHCVSNSIIYNIVSTKFRKAFFGRK